LLLTDKLSLVPQMQLSGRLGRAVRVSVPRLYGFLLRFLSPHLSAGDRIPTCHTCLEVSVRALREKGAL
jgi:hypothetical protein